VTIKTVFKKIGYFIEAIEALPKNDDNLTNEEFSDILGRLNVLQSDVTQFFIWNVIFKEPSDDNELQDSRDLRYNDRIEILLEVLRKTREKYLMIDPSLGFPVIRNKSHPKYLISIQSIPDDFYVKLIDEINILYANGRYISVCILVRKLLENLVIDILRKKFGTAQLELYYNPKKGMFNNFSTLLDNFDVKIDEFRHVDSNFNKSVLKRLNFYK
jgi:hypothetical protein